MKKTLKISLFCLMGLILLLINFPALAQDCTQALVRGPLPPGVAPETLRYQFDARQVVAGMTDEITCYWSFVDEEGNDIGSGTLIGEECKNNLLTREFEVGKKVTATFTLLEGTGQFMPEICRHDISFEVVVPPRGLEVTYPEIPGVEAPGPVTTPAEYVRYVYFLGLGIVGILALINLVIAGVMWITAGGNAAIIGAARKRIGATVAGILLLLGSYLLLRVINPELLILSTPQFLPSKLAYLDCRQIEKCKDYGEISRTEQDKIMACYADMCFVSVGGCAWHKEREECEPAPLNARGLHCGDFAPECRSYDKNELYTRFLGITFSTSLAENYCKTDPCGFGVTCWWSGTPIVDWLIAGLYNQCHELDCSQINECGDYPPLLALQGAGKNDIRETCLNDPCKVHKGKGDGFKCSPTSPWIPFLAFCKKVAK